MSTEKFLVTGATGRTGRHTVQHLLEKGHAVRALVHQEDERSEALRRTGAEVVVGDLLEHGDTIGATAGTNAAYFCYPIRPGLIQATAYLGAAAKRAGLKAVGSTCRRSLRGRIRRATRHAITGSANASSTGLVCPPSISARLSSRNG
jgi:NAD(P)H dehydrogenase (quinone)